MRGEEGPGGVEAGELVTPCRPPDSDSGCRQIKPRATFIGLPQRRR